MDSLVTWLMSHPRSHQLAVFLPLLGVGCYIILRLKRLQRTRQDDPLMPVRLRAAYWYWSISFVGALIGLIVAIWACPLSPGNTLSQTLIETLLTVAGTGFLTSITLADWVAKCIYWPIDCNIANPFFD